MVSQYYLRGDWMKYLIKSILMPVAMLFLFACGNNGDTQNEEKIQTQGYVKAVCNLYNNGRIYNDQKAMYVDFDTLESVPLCSKPNCNHTGSDCVANMVGQCPIIYNNYIYYLTFKHGVNEVGNGKREFYINSKLNRVSMETSEMETVKEFHDGVPIIADGYYLNGNELYFISTDMGPDEDEYGNISVSDFGGTQFLCSINLDTGEYINYGSVYDGDKQYEGASHSRAATIIGAKDSKLYIFYSYREKNYSVEELQKMQESGVDMGDTFTDLNFEFDMNTKTLSESELPALSYVDSDSYVYYDRTKEKAIVFYRGKEYELDADTRYNTSVINGKLFTQDTEKWYELSDMSEHDMGKYGDFKAIAYYDNCYILAYENQTVKLTEEELLALDEE